MPPVALIGLIRCRAGLDVFVSKGSRRLFDAGNAIKICYLVQDVAEEKASRQSSRWWMPAARQRKGALLRGS
jgi:hypothetical protein